MKQKGSYDIELYTRRDGMAPFSVWLAKLTKKNQARIISRLDRLEAGNFGDCKAVGAGVFELRFFFGSGYRVYYGLEGATLVLLLTGGDKKTQSKDIRKAKQYWSDYKKENIQ